MNCSGWLCPVYLLQLIANGVNEPLLGIKTGALLCQEAHELLHCIAVSGSRRNIFRRDLTHYCFCRDNLLALAFDMGVGKYLTGGVNYNHSILAVWI